MLMDNTADILLDNIMRVMSGEYFGQTKAAAIVGGKKKLERLIESVLHGKDCDKKALLPCFYKPEC